MASAILASLTDYLKLAHLALPATLPVGNALALLTLSVQPATLALICTLETIPVFHAPTSLDTTHLGLPVCSAT